MIQLESYLDATYNESLVDLIKEQLLEFILVTEIKSPEATQLAESEAEEYELQEYVIEDTVLSYIKDEALLEAIIESFFDRDYKTDKNGKKIVGMNKGTVKHSGKTKAERARQAARLYYGKPGRREEQNARMRAYRKKKRGDKPAREKREPRKKADMSREARSERAKAAYDRAHDTKMTNLANKNPVNRAEHEARAVLNAWEKDKREKGLKDSDMESWLKSHQAKSKKEPEVKKLSPADELAAWAKKRKK